MTDSLGRSWQLGTVQLDYSMPERFDLTYTGADNAEHRPVMIHRALFGSFERFIGILIEHYAGEFPLWLAPVQALVLPIADRHNDVRRARSRSGCGAAGLRAQLDDRTESVGRKIRDAELRKIPYMLVVGDREAEAGAAALRRHGEGDLGTLSRSTRRRAPRRRGRRAARARHLSRLRRRTRDRWRGHDPTLYCRPLSAFPLDAPLTHRHQLVPVPRRFDRHPPERDTTRINERIRVPEVRLIDETGQQVGIMRTEEALRYAQERDLDLVEVAPDAKPPVCRVLDYSKYKYEQAQKQKAARKHQQQITIREIKFRPKIAQHDYDTKKGHVEPLPQATRTRSRSRSCSAGVR